MKNNFHKSKNKESKKLIITLKNSKSFEILYHCIINFFFNIKIDILSFKISYSLHEKQINQ
jgi:hypothetical protein